jgi:hypothetical protein
VDSDAKDWYSTCIRSLNLFVLASGLFSFPLLFFAFRLCCDSLAMALGQIRREIATI